MTWGNFIFVISFLALLVEVLAGSVGILFPATAFVIFYLTVTGGWRLALLVAVIDGFVIDLLFQRSIPATPIALGLCLVLAIFWLYRTEAESLLLHVIPGTMLPAVCMVPVLLFHIIGSETFAENLFRLTANVLFCMMLGAFLLPVSIFVLDSIAVTLELPLYADARSKITDRGEGK